MSEKRAELKTQLDRKDSKSEASFITPKGIGHVIAAIPNFLTISGKSIEMEDLEKMTEYYTYKFCLGGEEIGDQRVANECGVAFRNEEPKMKFSPLNLDEILRRTEFAGTNIYVVKSGVFAPQQRELEEVPLVRRLARHHKVFTNPIDL